MELTWLHGARASADFPWSWQNDVAAGGGVLNALASHAVDLLTWLADSAVAAVDDSRVAILVPRRRDSQGALKEVTAEDWAMAQLRLVNGATAGLEVSNCIPDGQGMSITVTGEKGRLSCGQRPPFRAEDAFLVLEKPGKAAFPLPKPAPPGNAGVDTRLLAVRTLGWHFLEEIAGRNTDIPDFGAGLGMRRILDRLQQGPCARGKIE